MNASILPTFQYLRSQQIILRIELVQTFLSNMICYTAYRLTEKNPKPIISNVERASYQCDGFCVYF